MIVYTDHKNLTCKMFNTDILLIWGFILEYYGPGKEYRKGHINIVSDALSTLLINRNKVTTQ